MELFSKVEDFATGEICVDQITDFYKSDFDKEKLHQDMFLDTCKMKNYGSISDIVSLLSKPENVSLRDLLPEFLRIMLTMTSCTSERSFCAIRRLKTYLRSAMTQERLNDLSILHIHKDMTMNIDINEIANQFIKKTEVRRNTFFP